GIPGRVARAGFGKVADFASDGVAVQAGGPGPAPPRVERERAVVAVVEERAGSAPVERESKPVIRIEPSRRWLSLKLRDVWAARELLYFFVWRDVKVRYKQTVLGAAWAVIQPFFTMVVFTLFFGTLAKLSKDVQVPYPIFAYAGLLPWQFFASGLGQSATSLLSQRSTITKIYFPRMTVPLAAVLGGVVDFCVAFLVLIAMMLYYHHGVLHQGHHLIHYTIPFSPKALLIVPVLGIAAMTAFGVGMFLAALNVKYRD